MARPVGGGCGRADGGDLDQGLDADDVQWRLAEYGPNMLPTEPPPSVWVVAWGQLSNPMNIMLLIVGGASFAIGQVATGVVVLALVTFNVVMGSNQELKAWASVEALAQLQVSRARVRRSGWVEEGESVKLVPGDVVLLEAGDVVPADGRIVTSASLEVQEAALTGESAPVTKVFGLIAWLTVAVIAIFGIARGQQLQTLVLLCVSTAISAIPTGLPTFVQTMLSSGARRLAESKAVVKSLTDVETLGGTTIINSDKTGTLTMNAMTATTMLVRYPLLLPAAFSPAHPDQYVEFLTHHPLQHNANGAPRQFIPLLSNQGARGAKTRSDVEYITLPEKRGARIMAGQAAQWALSGMS